MNKKMSAGGGSASWDKRYFFQEISTNADKTEFEAFQRGIVPLTTGVDDERMADALDSFLPDDELGKNQWEDHEIAYEEATGSLLEELERRKALLGNLYPFSLDRGTVKYVKSEFPVYEFLLAICNAPNLTEGEFVNLPRTFEHLACRLARAYLGRNSGSFRTGWPRTNGLVRFKNVINTLKFHCGGAVGEWDWGPKPSLPDDPSPRDLKDLGLDVVAWKPHLDRRGGQLFLIGQCACGKNWMDKFSDLTHEGLEDWVREVSMVPAVRSFFTPWATVDAMLPDVTRKAGLVFDRSRLVLLASEALKESKAPRCKVHLEQLISLCCTG